MKKQYFKTPLLSLALLTSCMLPYACGDHNHEPVASQHQKEEEGHEAHSHSHAGMIAFDSHRAKEFGVETELIEASDFVEVISVSGRIESKSSDEAVVTATRSGLLTLSPNINQGVRISAGEAIGSIRSSGVQGGDPSVQAAAVRDAAKRELDRLTPLHKEGVVSTQVYNEALSNFEQAESSLRSSKQGSASVISSKSGVITQLLAKTGEFVETGQRVAVVSGNTSLTLRADVPETYIRQISGVESANFRTSSSSEFYNVGELNGRLISTQGSAVSDNGYIPLFFSFDNNGEVVPGAFAEVYLISGKRSNVVSVPKEAIVEISSNKCVYTLHEDGMYEKHTVSTGASDGRRVEILSGLNPGENVVVKGAQVVRMAETSATAVPGHTHNH